MTVSSVSVSFTPSSRCSRFVVRLQPATRLLATALVWLLIDCVSPPSAAADLVVFRTGRTMSIASYEVDGARVRLRLRRGGEIVCAREVIASIAPDEVRARAGAAAVLPARVPDATQPYHALVAHIAAREGVDPRLIHAVIAVESAYRPTARSAKGAMGLMQLMPETARQYAVADPYDPAANIEAGTRHLRYLLDRFELSLALAAYNAGETAVSTHEGIPPYPETRAYVARVLGRLGIAPPTE